MYNLSGDFQPEGKSVIGNEALSCPDPRPPADGDFALGIGGMVLRQRYQRGGSNLPFLDRIGRGPHSQFGERRCHRPIPLLSSEEQSDRSSLQLQKHREGQSKQHRVEQRSRRQVSNLIAQPSPMTESFATDLFHSCLCGSGPNVAHRLPVPPSLLGV